MLDRNTLLLILLIPFFLSCSTQKTALPDTNRPPNLIEQLCSCTNSEGRTMEEAARLYQEEYGVSWEAYLASPPEETDDWIRKEFLLDELYMNKLQAVTEEAEKDANLYKEAKMEDMFEKAAQNYPFCAEQMEYLLISLVKS